MAAGTGERGDWRARTLARVRALIRQADPDAIEERKWKKPSNPAGVPVWSHDGTDEEAFKILVRAAVGLNRNPGHRP